MSDNCTNMELLSDKLEIQAEHAAALAATRTGLSGGERVYQNPILVYCIIWLFDTGQFEMALRWADICQ